MQFNKLQFTAVIKLGKMMTLADGKIDQREIIAMKDIVTSFGVSASDFQNMLELGDAMEPTTACAIIYGMDASQKKYVCSMLASIMIVDGNVDKTEQALWTLLSGLCGLPQMTILEALQFMSKEL